MSELQGNRHHQSPERSDRIPDDPPRITHAMEDYLKGIYRLQETADPVSTQLLADELGISPASVTNMVKRLDELRLVAYSRYHGVRLTEAGERVALEVIRHHRLLELYLAESLGYGWDEVHAEAERLEHLVSDALEARMDEALGFPTRDPHGDPIPSREGEIDAGVTIPLLDLKAGQTAVVARVSDKEAERLRLLGDLGLVPGASVRLVEAGASSGALSLLVDGVRRAVDPRLAAAVFLAVTDGG